MRLIDAEEIEGLFYKQIEYGATDLMDAFDDALQDDPTVDAVEVVRCKDCNHYKLVERMGADYYICAKPEGLIRPSEMDFCSYGERKSGTQPQKEKA